MKKIILFLIASFIFIFCFEKVCAEEVNLAPNAKSSILIEASTGEVIYSNNENERFAPASMTKIMSLIIIMEEIEKGNLKLDEKIVVSQNAASMGGSQIYLEVGEEMTVNDLLKAICVGSANDAVVALTERIAGTEQAFVFKMNEKAKKLKLKNTNFKNSTGLDEANHYSSAYDMSVMARELVKHKKILEYSGIYETYLRQNTTNKFWLVNTNKLIKVYDGMDGLKTGYTKEAGYCLTATANRNNMRLIGVIMGEETSQKRNEEMTKLLDYGFNMYSTKQYLKTTDKVSELKLDKANISKVNVVPKENINILNKKGNKNRKIKYEVVIENDKLPIKKGDKIGYIKIIEKNKEIARVDAIVVKNVKRANIVELFFRNFILYFNGENIF